MAYPRKSRGTTTLDFLTGLGEVPIPQHQIGENTQPM
jgi:hypothetical protein